jgi:probable rRNA maturation factor
MKKIDFDNQSDISIDIEDSLEGILSSLSDKSLEVIVVDNDTIASINAEYRGKNAPTDVLSFPLEDIGMGMLGSIVISIDKAIEKSHEFNHSLEDEMKLLFIHGLLHLLGYDHEVDNGQMREKEKEIILKYNLPSSLIVRTEEG